MSIGLTNFKFYRSFRVRVDDSDKINIKIRVLNGKDRGLIIHEEVKLVDFNLFSLSFKSKQEIAIGSTIKIELITKKIFNKWDIEFEGTVIRSFLEHTTSDYFNYGVELINQNNDSELKYFITDHIANFSSKKLKKFLIKSALSAREINSTDGVELFTLLNVLYKEFNGSNIEELIKECKHILNCEEARVWKINIDNDKLENIITDEASNKLKEINFSKGDVGMSFTTSKCINTFFKENKKRNEDEFLIRNTLCLPLLNKEQKCVGVLQFNNKLDSHFSLQDEIVANFITMVISKTFINYLPKSKSSRIAHLNPELEDDFIYFGAGQKAASIRSTLKKLKYGRNNIHIVGEQGLGKEFFAKELANTKKLLIVNCREKESFKDLISTSLPLSNNTLILKNIHLLNSKEQNEIFDWSQFNECQFITTSTQDLSYLVENGFFHKALHKKITQSLFHVTPLRNRKKDILSIAKYFIKIECKKRNQKMVSLSSTSLDYLFKYNWPGNITQLEKLIIKAFMIKPENDNTIDLSDIDTYLGHENIEEEIADSCDLSIHPYKILELIQDLEDQEEAA